MNLFAKPGRSTVTCRRVVTRQLPSGSFSWSTLMSFAPPAANLRWRNSGSVRRSKTRSTSALSWCVTRICMTGTLGPVSMHVDDVTDGERVEEATGRRRPEMDTPVRRLGQRPGMERDATRCEEHRPRHADAVLRAHPVRRLACHPEQASRCAVPRPGGAGPEPGVGPPAP